MQDIQTGLCDVRLCAISCNQERTDVHVLIATRAVKVRFSSITMSKNRLSRSTQMLFKHRGVQLGVIRESHGHTGRVSIPAMMRLQFSSLSLDARDSHVSHAFCSIARA